MAGTAKIREKGKVGVRGLVKQEMMTTSVKNPLRCGWKSGKERRHTALPMSNMLIFRHSRMSKQRGN
jgi:hypothetical protein